jgi:Fic/DOC family
VVAIAFTALASIYSIYRYFKIRKASLPIVIDQTSTGNGFLISQIVELQKSGDKREEDYISFAIIHTRCKEKNNYNLRDLFPKHRLTASDIHQCSIEQLLNLKGRDFFAIIDLISGKQAMQILIYPTCYEHRIMALHYFNKEFAKAFSDRQKIELGQPIEMRINEKAQHVFTDYKKYTPQDMSELQSQPCFKDIDQLRMRPCATMNQDDSNKKLAAQFAWKKLNEVYLTNGIQKKITKEFLLELNTKLRLDESSSPQPPYGIRGPRQEVSCPSRSLYYLPGYQTAAEVDVFLTDLNAEIDDCDKGKQNPIVISAKAYQRFVTIHPFHDGNGRTGRLLADLILRRYELLPAAWGKDNKIAIFPLGTHGGISSTQAVEKMLQALHTSYTTVEL